MRTRVRHQPVRLRLPDVRRPAPTPRRVDVSRLPLDRWPWRTAPHGGRRSSDSSANSATARFERCSVASPGRCSTATRWPGESRPLVARRTRSSRWLAIVSSMRTAPICRPFGSTPTPRRTSSPSPSTPAPSPARRTSSSAGRLRAVEVRRLRNAGARGRATSSSSHGARCGVDAGGLRISERSDHDEVAAQKAADQAVRSSPSTARPTIQHCGPTPRRGTTRKKAARVRTARASADEPAIQRWPSIRSSGIVTIQRAPQPSSRSATST